MVVHEVAMRDRDVGSSAWRPIGPASLITGSDFTHWQFRLPVGRDLYGDEILKLCRTGGVLQRQPLTGMGHVLWRLQDSSPVVEHASFSLPTPDSWTHDVLEGRAQPDSLILSTPLLNEMKLGLAFRFVQAGGGQLSLICTELSQEDFQRYRSQFPAATWYFPERLASLLGYGQSAHPTYLGEAKPLGRALQAAADLSRDGFGRYVITAGRHGTVIGQQGTAWGVYPVPLEHELGYPWRPMEDHFAVAVATIRTLEAEPHLHICAAHERARYLVAAVKQDWMEPLIRSML